MKLFNKIISTVCALGLLATTAVSVVSVQAKEYTKPEISAQLTSYDKETGEGAITVSLNGVESALVDDYADYYVAGAVVYVGLNSDDFVITGYYNSPAIVKKTITKVDGYDYGGTLTPGKYNTSSQYCKVSLAGTGEVGDMPNIFKVPFKVNKDSANKNKVITINEAEINIMMDSANKATLKSTDGNVDIADAAIKIMIPTDGTTVNIDPTDVGLDADAWTDGTSTVAVGLTDFAAPASAASKIEWTIKATPVGGTEETKTQVFDLDATIEAAATIGLIVNYDTNEFSSVSVVSGALK